MFNDWSDDKLLEEVKQGFRDYVDIKVKNNKELINYYREQIRLKEQEINKLEWEMGVASKNIDEWQEVLNRIDTLLSMQNPEEQVEEPTNPENQQS